MCCPLIKGFLCKNGILSETPLKFASLLKVSLCLLCRFEKLKPVNISHLVSLIALCYRFACTWHPLQLRLCLGPSWGSQAQNSQTACPWCLLPAPLRILMETETKRLTISTFQLQWQQVRKPINISSNCLILEHITQWLRSPH